MAISRMQQPRQMYGLGSFVKKAFRGVKKIAKSPLGKAALMYAGTAGLGALAGGAGGTGFTGAAFSPRGIAGNFGNFAPSLFKGAVGKTGPQIPGFFPKMFGKMTTGQKIFAGLGATAVASPFISKMFGKGPEEMVEEVDENYIDPYTAMMMAKFKNPQMNFLPEDRFTDNYYQTAVPAANGGRIGYAGGMLVEDEEDINLNRPNMMRRGYANGEMVEESITEEVKLPDEAEQMLQVEYQKYIEGGGQLPYPEFKKLVLQQMQQERASPDETMVAETETVEAAPTAMMAGGGLTSVPGYGTPAGTNKFGYPSGGVRVGAEEGGLMNLGGMEKDYRAEGGFVPIGAKEKADDVPARLSVNEFVFTADAVRNAGGGDIDKGAEVMENMMNHLENGGQVSEESQGGEGAQAMYDQQQMLQSRMG